MIRLLTLAFLLSALVLGAGCKGSPPEPKVKTGGLDLKPLPNPKPPGGGGGGGVKPGGGAGTQ